MSENTLFIIFILLAVITLGLAGYLGYLWATLNKRHKELALYKQELAKKLMDREKSILESLRIIALAVTQDQCEISEGVIRIKNLIDEVEHLKLAPTLQDFHRIHALFAEFPYLDERKELSKQERFSQDTKRFQIEKENEKRVKDLCFELLAIMKAPKH